MILLRFCQPLLIDLDLEFPMQNLSLLQNLIVFWVVSAFGALSEKEEEKEEKEKWISFFHSFIHLE